MRRSFLTTSTKTHIVRLMIFSVLLLKSKKKVDIEKLGKWIQQKEEKVGKERWKKRSGTRSVRLAAVLHHFVPEVVRVPPLASPVLKPDLDLKVFEFKLVCQQ